MWEGVQWIQIANIMWLLSTTLLASSGVLCNSKHHMDCKHKHHWSEVQVQNKWFIRNWIHYWKWHSAMHSTKVLNKFHEVKTNLVKNAKFQKWISIWVTFCFRWKCEWFAKLIQSISFMFVVQLTTSCIWRILQSENVFIMAELLSSIPLTAKSPICDQLLL